MNTGLLEKSEPLINKKVEIQTTLGDFFKGVLTAIKVKGNIIYLFLADNDGKKVGIPETTIINVEELKE